MKKYLISLRFIFILFIFLLVSCALAGKPTVKEQPVEKVTVKESVERKPEIVKDSEAQKLGLAPDFKLQDLNKNTFTFSDYKDKQPVVLFFWSTWCPFCRRELRLLKDIYPQLLKDGWELFAIDVGEPIYRVVNFVESYALAFKVLLDKDTTVADSYDIFGVPTYVLVDKKGYIVFNDNYFPQGEYKELISK